VTPPEAAEAPAARVAYSVGRLRGEVLSYERLGSTNDALKALAAAGAREGTVVVADAQDAGRGRQGRAWHSPAGAGFYGSVLLRPGPGAGAAQFLTFAAAVAVAEALEGLGVAGVEVKWPNDVLVGGRKACGILTESSFLGERLEWAVVGIGINLTRVAVPPGLDDSVTSLEEAGVSVSAVAIRAPLLASLDRWYSALLESGAAAVLARWEALAPMARGRRVTVAAGGESFEATTAGLAPDGRLRVQREGEVVEISAADVTLGAGCRVLGPGAEPGTEPGTESPNPSGAQHPAPST
jgi:BirA family biotin operon repressor/biotin-[acetyl-CoA-carboxylase] ligase